MPGFNYATWSAALIPREGIVLGAINPAKYAWIDGHYSPKRNPAKSRAGTRVIFGVSGADTVS